jgi:PAS domain S-box-containing protein
MEQVHGTEKYRTPISKARLKELQKEIEDLLPGLEALSIHTVITDEHANILYANKAVEQITGFSPKEILGKNVGDLWGGKMPKEYYKKMWRTIKEDRQPFAEEIQNTKKDGTEYWQELYVSPILGEQGKVKFFIGLEPNITDRKKREEFHNEFISILAHQTKNPLTTIRWTVDWLVGQGNLSVKQKQGLEQIVKQTQGLVDLVRDLLVIASINKEEKVTAREEHIDLHSAVESIVEETKKQFPKTVVTLENDAGRITIALKKSLVVQILKNVIWNAFEYSNKKDGRVELSLTEDKGNYVFRCRDNGIGIPDGEQQKLFRTFFRASNSTEMKQQGTGLGLFIVKLLTDYLGWTVSLESKVGVGTTVVITIPTVKQ